MNGILVSKERSDRAWRQPMRMIKDRWVIEQYVDMGASSRVRDSRIIPVRRAWKRMSNKNWLGAQWFSAIPMKKLMKTSCRARKSKFVSKNCAVIKVQICRKLESTIASLM